jgi:hypothetical protein
VRAQLGKAPEPMEGLHLYQTLIVRGRGSVDHPRAII